MAAHIPPDALQKAIDTQNSSTNEENYMIPGESCDRKVELPPGTIEKRNSAANLLNPHSNTKLPPRGTKTLRRTSNAHNKSKKAAPACCALCRIKVSKLEPKLVVDCETCHLHYCLVCLGNGSLKDPCVRCGHPPSKRIEKLVQLRLKSIRRSSKSMPRPPNAPPPSSLAYGQPPNSDMLIPFEVQKHPSPAASPLSRKNIVKRPVPIDTKTPTMVLPGPTTPPSGRLLPPGAPNSSSPLAPGPSNSGPLPSGPLNSGCRFAPDPPNSGRLLPPGPRKSGGPFPPGRLLPSGSPTSGQHFPVPGHPPSSGPHPSGPRPQIYRGPPPGTPPSGPPQVRSPPHAASPHRAPPKVSEEELKRIVEQKQKEADKAAKALLAELEEEEEAAEAKKNKKKRKKKKKQAQKQGRRQPKEEIKEQAQQQPEEEADDTDSDAEEDEAKSSASGQRTPSSDGPTIDPVEKKLWEMIEENDIDGIEGIVFELKGVTGRRALRMNAKRALKHLQQIRLNNTTAETLDTTYSQSDEESCVTETTPITIEFYLSNHQDGPLELLRLVSDKDIPSKQSKRAECVMQISPLVVGWVIGKSGQRIRDLMEESGAKIWIDQENVKPKEFRNMYFNGKRKSVNQAVRMVRELVSRAPVINNYGNYGNGHETAAETPFTSSTPSVASREVSLDGNSTLNVPETPSVAATSLSQESSHPRSLSIPSISPIPAETTHMADSQESPSSGTSHSPPNSAPIPPKVAKRHTISLPPQPQSHLHAKPQSQPQSLPQSQHQSQPQPQARPQTPPQPQHSAFLTQNHLAIAPGGPLIGHSEEDRSSPQLHSFLEHEEPSKSDCLPGLDTFLLSGNATTTPDYPSNTFPAASRLSTTGGIDLQAGELGILSGFSTITDVPAVGCPSIVPAEDLFAQRSVESCMADASTNVDSFFGSTMGDPVEDNMLLKGLFDLISEDTDDHGGTTNTGLWNGKRSSVDYNLCC